MVIPAVMFVVKLELAAVTVTDAFALALPPLPVQVMV